MKYFQSIATILALSLAAGLVACSGGSSSSGGNPITVALSGAPGSMTVNGTASITATVSNDSANGGVTWSCAPSGSCGSFSPTSTPSGTATTYTAPGTAATVTVTATSVTAPTKSASATIAVGTAPIALADGNYVFSLVGADSTSPAYSVAGVFTVSGGAITGGEQDFADVNTAAHDMINTTGNNITTTGNGNLQLTLSICSGTNCAAADTNVGVAGIETINGTPLSASDSNFRIVEFDTFATSSGTLDFQDSTAKAAKPTGGYAFGIQGITSGGGPLAIAGILNISSGTISPTGTVFDLETGNPLADQTISAGSVTAPDSFGRVLFSLTPTNSGSIGVLNLAGYIVDGTHIRLVEGSDQLGGSTGGTALAQNSASLAVPAATYVVGLTGVDTTGAFQMAGALSLSGGSTGTVGGNWSYNDLFNGQTSSIPITAGTYTADATNLGRVTLSGLNDTVNTFNINLYLDGNGNAFAMTLDTLQDVLEGAAYQQTPGAAFSGSYVLTATGADSTNEDELDAVGPVTTGSGTFSGFADLNWLSTGTAATPSSGLPVAGAFTAPSNGLSTGAGNTITGLEVTTSSNADAFDYYVVDANTVIAIETDSNQLTLGTFELTQ